VSSNRPKPSNVAMDKDAGEETQEIQPELCEPNCIIKLYSLCIEAFQEVSNRGSCASEKAQADIINEAGRLQLWGDGFNPEEGGLDILLSQSIELKETTVVMLSRLARQLQRRKIHHRILFFADSGHVCSCFPWFWPAPTVGSSYPRVA